MWHSGVLCKNDQFSLVLNNEHMQVPIKRLTSIANILRRLTRCITTMYTDDSYTPRFPPLRHSQGKPLSARDLPSSLLPAESL